MAPSRTVLLIDDDETALLTEAQFLSLEGYHSLTAASASAGLESVETAQPDVILLDLKLPEVKDGLGVLREIRTRGYTTPIAVVTGAYLDEKTYTEIRGLDASIAYKPLWVEDLLALVRDLLDGSP